MKTWLRLIYIPLIFLFFFIISPEITRAELKSNQNEFVLNSQQSIGQTFLSKYAGLDDLSVSIAPHEPGNGKLILEILSKPESNKVLTKVEFSIQNLQQPLIYHFTFAPLRSSYLQGYYARFRIEGQGAIIFKVLDASANSDGAMYVGDHPIEAQLAVNFGYDRFFEVTGLIRQAGTWAVDILFGVFLFVIPGWGILTLAWKGSSSLSFWEKAGLGSGISAALYPVLYVLAYSLGISPGRYLVWVVIIFDLLYLLYSMYRYPWKFVFSRERKFAIQWESFSLLLIVFFILFSRFWVIRFLPAPMGSDSIQHGAITQLILDHGGLFQSWLPYAEYKTFTTHFGFHVLAAVYSWLSGENTLQSILLVGQIINVLSILAIYPLVMLITDGKQWSGVASVAAAGLMSSMPAFYVNWGRYPQLAGLFILPVALWFSIKAISCNENRYTNIIIGGITLAGMFFSYYRLPFFYGTFLFAWLICWGVPVLKWKSKFWLEILKRLVLIGIAGGILILPWAGRIFASRMNNEEIHGSIQNFEQVVQDYKIWKDIFTYLPLPLLIGGLLGVFVSILRRNLRQLSLVFWMVELFMIVSAALLNIPGTNLMQNTVVIISVYLPFSILFGIFIAETREWLGRNSAYSHFDLVFASLIIVAGIFGMIRESRIADPGGYAFLTWPDLRAMTWIRENLPEDANFFVQGQRFKETSVIGGDAGWWLPVLTQRGNSMPPQYALVMEYSNEKGYNEKVINRVFDLEKTNLDQSQGLKVLCEGNFNYVYIGEKQLYIDPRSHDSFFTSKELSSNPDFKLIYHQDLVSIFSFSLQSCKD